MRKILRQFVESRRFSLADLLIVLGCGVIWYYRPEFGWKILLIALLPWGVRLLAGRTPFKFTIFDLPIFVFVLTAVIGVKVAYNQQESWAKFWLLVAAVLIFYGLASQARENTWLFVEILSGLGALTAIFFLFEYDWQTNPVTVEAINRLGMAWMRLRPVIPIRLRDMDSISSLLLVLSPFSIVLFMQTWQTRQTRRSLFIFSVVSLAFLSVGFGMAAMLEGLIVILIGAFIAIWWTVGKKLEQRKQYRVRSVFLLGTMVVLTASIFFIIRFPEKILEKTKPSSALGRFEERLEISKNTIQLAGDFPFTGGGLGAFPGLYSRYILVIPYLFIPTSYNLFQEIALEQGSIGCLAYASILVGGAFLLIHQFWARRMEPEQNLLSLAALAGYWAVIAAGMLDTTLYEGLDILFLLIIPGFSVLAFEAPHKFKSGGYYPDILMAAGLFVLLISLGRNLFAVYYANLGAVEMARLDLAGWPWEGNQEPKVIEDYQVVTQYFQMAKRLDDGNSTANYRLGMLAVGRQDFPEGCRYLKRAFVTSPNHRGIIKNLGFCYVWLGNLDSATAYLRGVPEASYELEVYSWWWGTQNRNDLSDYANQMVLRLISK